MLKDGPEDCVISSSGTSYAPGPGVVPLRKSKKVGVDFYLRDLILTKNPKRSATRETERGASNAWQ